MGTVPVPYSPVAGDDATQARVLTWADSCAYLLGSATSGGSKRPLAVLRQTVAQSFATGVPGPVTFDAEDVDYDNGHSTVTNTSRYTAATAGWHFVVYALSWASNVTGFRDAWIRKNGTVDVVPRAVEINAGAVQSGLVGSCWVSLAVGDFIEVWGNQNSGAALNTFVTSPDQSYMAVEWRSN